MWGARFVVSQGKGGSIKNWRQESGEHEGTFSGDLCVKLLQRAHTLDRLFSRSTSSWHASQGENANLAYESHDDDGDDDAAAGLRFSNGIVLRTPNKELACC
jgi:hypothetical protein